MIDLDFIRRALRIALFRRELVFKMSYVIVVDVFNHLYCGLRIIAQVGSFVWILCGTISLVIIAIVVNGEFF